MRVTDLAGVTHPSTGRRRRPRADQRATRRSVIVLVLLTGALSLVACGDQDGAPTTTTTTMSSAPGDAPGPDGTGGTGEGDADGSVRSAGLGDALVPPAMSTSELTALAKDCFDGDLGACDETYFTAGGDEAAKEYGLTCGGRAAEPQFGQCASLSVAGTTVP